MDDATAKANEADLATAIDGDADPEDRAFSEVMLAVYRGHPRDMTVAELHGKFVDERRRLGRE